MHAYPNWITSKSLTSIYKIAIEISDRLRSEPIAYSKDSVSSSGSNLNKSLGMLGYNRTYILITSFTVIPTKFKPLFHLTTRPNVNPGFTIVSIGRRVVRIRLIQYELITKVETWELALAFTIWLDFKSYRYFSRFRMK